MMTVPVIPAPAVPQVPTAFPTGEQSPRTSGLPAPRTPDPAECATALALDVDDRGRIAVLRARGEVDMLTVVDLRTALDDQLAAGTGTVVVDMRGVSFVDCTGIALLADARRRAHRRGIRLRILPGRAVARVSALLGLAAVLGLPEQG
jgi:anti-sigma B factor antagonist